MFILENSGVYKIVSKRDGKYYPGSSKHLIKGKHNRKSQHFYMLRRNIHHCQHLQRAYNQYGKENFEFVIIKNNIPIDQLLIEEQKLLDIARTEPEMCYTHNYLADRIEMNPETKRKMSLARIGKYIGEKSPDYIKVSPKLTKILKKAWIKLGKYGFLKYAKEKYGVGDHPAKRLIKLYRKDPLAVLSRKKFYSQKIKEIVGPINRKRIGILHPRADKTIYHFFNINTIKTFIGNKYDFVKKYSINLKDIHPLTARKIKKTRAGWTIKRPLIRSS
jgi:hypothetical protein